MNKIKILQLTAIVLGFFFLISASIDWGGSESRPQIGAAGYKDATYIINATPVGLIKGVSEVEAAPGSASKIITRYFGNEARHDLDGDGREDVVFLLTQSTGGTGTFYYVVAALNTERGYVGSHAFFLGDRIAPQTTEISRNPNHVNVIVVNYADRAPGESFADRPSIGTSVWLKLDPATMQFGEVVNDFEGEADPKRMTLDMNTWTWVRTLMNNDTEVVPRATKAFTVTFGNDGKFSITTDCNSGGGSYVAGKDGSIAFKDMFSTKMYCEGSQESEFTALLNNAATYHFTSRGELILDLKFDSGSVIFR